jgi:hypothetical protein
VLYDADQVVPRALCGQLRCSVCQVSCVVLLSLLYRTATGYVVLLFSLVLSLQDAARERMRLRAEIAADKEARKVCLRV